MHTYTDTKNRTWSIVIDVTAIKRVRELSDVDLVGEIRDIAVSLVDDPMWLADVLFALLKPACDQAKVDEAEFGRGLAGDTIDHARIAFLGELAEFFTEPKRGIIKRAIAKIDEAMKRAGDAMLTRLEDPQLDAEIDEILNGPPAW